MRKFQLTIGFLLLIVVGLLIYIRIAPRQARGEASHTLEEKEVKEEVRIAFLDIGQGDATLIDFPDGSEMLVDCSKDDRIMEALGRVMPFYDHTIDYLLVTHPDLDHYGGCIDVMKRFEIRHIVYNGVTKDDSFWYAFMDEIEQEKKKGVDYIEMDKEQTWDIASTTLHFLYPDRPLRGVDIDSNDTSIVFTLTYGDQDVLLTGDAEAATEQHLIERYGGALDVEVLKAGHHGSGSSSIQEFVDATSPDFSIISVGKNNSYGHPAPRVVKRLERAGSAILRTDEEGDILMTITKDAIYVEDR